MTDIRYLVVVDVAAHDGHIAEVDIDGAWPAPNGWTLQEIQGPHGSVYGEHEELADAERELDEWLECPAAERGEYCYTHNPTASR